MKIMTDTFIAIACINHHDICILHKELGNDGIHMETFTTTTWTEAEEIGVIGVFDFTFLACNINGNRDALTIRVVNIKP